LQHRSLRFLRIRRPPPILRPDWDVNAGGATLNGKAKLDPWLVGAGVTYRF
jgi:outer membrane protein W